MALLVGSTVTRIQMAPEEGTLGAAWIHPTTGRDPLDKARRQLFVSCGGLAGEALLEINRPMLRQTDYERMQGANIDMERIYRFMADPLSVEADVRESYFLAKMDLARRALRSPASGTCSARLRYALLKAGELSEAEVLAIWSCDRVAQMACSWIDRHLAAEAA